MSADQLPQPAGLYVIFIASWGALLTTFLSLLIRSMPMALLALVVVAQLYWQATVQSMVPVDSKSLHSWIGLLGISI